MNTAPARHTWALTVNGILIGLWPEGGIVRLRLPYNAPDAVKQMLEHAVRTWMVRSAAEMDKRKGK